MDQVDIQSDFLLIPKVNAFLPKAFVVIVVVIFWCFI